jgi:ribonuclease BN (tRNA processing enzyme)
LVIDAGSGFLPLSKALIAEGIWNIDLLFTHWHHDHTQGLLLAPHTYMEQARFKVWGPTEHKLGPAEVFEMIMQAPLFPVPFGKVRHRFTCKPLEHIGTQVLVVHPEAGAHLMHLHQLRTCEAEGTQLPLGRKRHDVQECLVIYMYKTAHPEYTVSFRFEERPTGKVFVFLTDHESTNAFPTELVAHVKGADLLIEDAQYAETVYQERTAGFGHATPEYCVRLALKAGVQSLGLTHFDPMASDEEARARVAEAVATAHELGNAALAERIFGCVCYGIYDC